MPYKNRNVARQTALCLMLFVLAGLLRGLGMLPRYPSWLLSQIRSMIYTGIVLFWMFSVSDRVVHTRIRRCLGASGGLCILWLLLRICRYDYFKADHLAQVRHLNRILWYGYYIPQILIPLLGFLAVLCIGRREKEGSRWERLIWLPALALIVLVMTNDLHQLCFYTPGSAEVLETHYVHGIGYYLCAAWIGGMMAIDLILMMHRSRNYVRRRMALIPVAVFLAGFLLALSHEVGLQDLWHFPESFMAGFIWFWESCFQIGLIPGNTGYEAFFKDADMSAVITGQDGEICYRTKKELEVGPDTLAEAMMGPVMLDEDRQLSEADIPGGHVFWVTDFSDVHSVQRALAETERALAEETQLIEAENEIRQRAARVREQELLYDEIRRFSADYLGRIRGELETLETEMVPENLALACFYTAYVKRRSNMMILAREEMLLPVRELVLAVRESLDYLNYRGIAASVSGRPEGSIAAGELIRLYDFFEAVAEALLPSLSSLLVSVNEGEGTVQLKLMADGPLQPPDLSPERYEGMQIAAFEEDGTLYISGTAAAGASGEEVRP